MSALAPVRNSITRSRCKPRLIFQLTTRTEFGGKITQLGVAKVPVSICSSALMACFQSLWDSSTDKTASPVSKSANVEMHLQHLQGVHDHRHFRHLYRKR